MFKKMLIRFTILIYLLFCAALIVEIQHNIS